MIIFFLIISCVVCQTNTVTCATYDENANQSSMRIESNGTNKNMVISRCPPGKKKAPPPLSVLLNTSKGLQLSVCITPLKKGEKCNDTYASACETGICIKNKCVETVTSGDCTSDLDCSDGYYCKNGSVTKSLHRGDECTRKEGPFECYRGACSNRTKRCVTYFQWYLTLEYPRLIGGDSTGFKNCNNSSLDSDCKYEYKNSTMTASQLGLTCIETEYANPPQKYCEMGGGEAAFRNLVKMVLQFYFIFYISLTKTRITIGEKY